MSLYRKLRCYLKISAKDDHVQLDNRVMQTEFVFDHKKNKRTKIGLIF